MVVKVGVRSLFRVTVHGARLEVLCRDDGAPTYGCGRVWRSHDREGLGARFDSTLDAAA